MTNFDKQDEAIQKLSIDALKNWANQAHFVTRSYEGTQTDGEDALTASDIAIQQMPLDVWRKRATHNIALKMAKTGLTSQRILLIESDKLQASLFEIIQYCNGLNIAFKDFLPELFEPKLA
jgi:hypothetical protein